METDEKIVREVVDADGKHEGWAVFCPACGNGHMFDARWRFDGNMESPTFSPSMLVRTAIQGNPDRVCHSFVTAGQWRYQTDSTHDKKGMTVPCEKF